MLTIGKLADAGGVGVETIRFYQRKQLLGTPTRDEGIRRYGEEDVRRLRFIKELIELDSGQDHHRAHELAARRIAKLDEQIAELQRAQECLRRLAKECAAGTSGPCPIIATFEA
jgi:MerR family mercuric resistance operon transcriptional regulator